MLWIYIAIISYLLFAVSSLADRHLLAGPLPRPRSYAFYIGITGILATVFIPFVDFHIPDPSIILLSLATGALGVITLTVFYRALFHGRVSTVVPTIGAITPLFTVGFAILIAGESFLFTEYYLGALFFLIVGTVLLSLRTYSGSFSFSRQTLIDSLFASVLFSLGFVLAKIIFESEGFFTGFIWMRWGGFLAALSLLVFPDTRAIIFKKNPIKKERVWLPLLIGKGAGSLGFFLQSYAVSLARFSQIALINAMAGVQYIFLLILVIIIGWRNPKLLKEELSGRSLLFRLSGIISIILGLYLLSL